MAGLPLACTLLMNPCSSNQFEQATEEGSHLPRQRPPTAHTPKFLPQALTLQGVTTVGVRRPALRVVPRAARPVTQPTRGAPPGPQLHQRVRPQVQVERRHVGPVVTQLLLARPMDL